MDKPQGQGEARGYTYIASEDQWWPRVTTCVVKFAIHHGIVCKLPISRSLLELRDTHFPSLGPTLGSLNLVVSTRHIKVLNQLHNFSVDYFNQ